MSNTDVYGLTKEGFKRKRLPEIKTQMFDRFEDFTGTKVNRNSDSVLGVIFGIAAYEFSDLWRVGEDNYNAMYANTADGVNLNNVAMTSGIVPIDAEQTKVYITCYGVDGTAIESGSIVSSTTDTDTTYSSMNDSTISKSNANYVEISMQNTPENNVTYKLSLNAKESVYTAKTSDTKANVLIALCSKLSVTGITFTITNDVLVIKTTDRTNTFNINVTGVSIDKVGTPILFECNSFGAITPILNDLTSITTGVNGWNSASNESDAIVGRDAETDTSLRQRWNAYLYNNSVAQTESIQAAVLSNVTGVTSCRVFENTKDTADEDGRPPHSIEVVVLGGDNKAIAKQIFSKKAPGIDTYGDNVISIQDSQDVAHEIRFNHPKEVKVWLKIALTKLSEEEWSSDNRDKVMSAVLSVGNALSLGQDVIIQRFIGDIYKNTKGVATVSITATTGEVAGEYSSENITISARELAVFDESRIEVTENIV